MKQPERALPPRAERTDAAVDPAVLAADVDAVLDVLQAGGIAIIPTCLTYAIVANAPDAVERIFAAKGRPFSKPCGLFGSPAMSAQVHRLDERRREIIRLLAEDARLPFSVVAPFDPAAPILRGAAPRTIERSSRAGTMDMVISGGPFVAALAARSMARGLPVFGSSANASSQGSRYRLQDVEAEVRAVAALELDYGVSRWATPLGLSSTIIDFADFSVVRAGHCFDQLVATLQARWQIALAPAATHA